MNSGHCRIYSIRRCWMRPDSCLHCNGTFAVLCSEAASTIEILVIEDIGRLPREVETALFRIVQESLDEYSSPFGKPQRGHMGSERSG